MRDAVIVAIDGPAGSGKSTVSRLVAQKLGLLYIDTGAMYRALTLKAMDRGIDIEDTEALVSMAKTTNIDLVQDLRALSVILDGTDVTSRIRTLDVTQQVKYIARVPGVRQEMVKKQRLLAEKKGAVLEGRDIGTIVFPDAQYKFYLDADFEKRVERRYKELLEAGQPVGREDIRQDIIARDRSDMMREVGPLKKADDAVSVDTTSLTIDGVVNELLSHIEKGPSRVRGRR